MAPYLITPGSLLPFPVCLSSQKPTGLSTPALTTATSHQHKCRGPPVLINSKVMLTSIKHDIQANKIEKRPAEDMLFCYRKIPQPPQNLDQLLVSMKKKKVVGLRNGRGREGCSVLVSVLPSNAEPNTILKQTSNLLLNLKLTLFNCSFIDVSMKVARIRPTCPGPLVLVAILWAFASPMSAFPFCPLAVVEAWSPHTGVDCLALFQLLARATRVDMVPGNEFCERAVTSKGWWSLVTPAFGKPYSLPHPMARVK